MLLGLPLAIFLGLFLGKTVGISLFTYVAIRVKLCAWPEGMNLPRLISLSVLGGIGFTVSLFIANLAYGGPEMAQLLNEAKLGTSPARSSPVSSAICSSVASSPRAKRSNRPSL